MARLLNAAIQIYLINLGLNYFRWSFLFFWFGGLVQWRLWKFVLYHFLLVSLLVIWWRPIKNTSGIYKCSYLGILEGKGDTGSLERDGGGKSLISGSAPHSQGPIIRHLVTCWVLSWSPLGSWREARLRQRAHIVSKFLVRWQVWGCFEKLVWWVRDQISGDECGPGSNAS